MKQYLKILSIALIAFVVSCSDDEFGPVQNVSDSVMQLTSSATSVEMSSEVNNDVVYKLTWNQPTLEDYVVLENYQIFIDLQGNEFKNPKKINAGKELMYDFKASELNATILDYFKYEVGQPINMELKVVAIAGNEIIAGSNTVALKTTAYENALNLTSPWGVVGSATVNGWNGPDMPFYKDPNQENVFVAYVTLTDGEIKFRKDNDWTLNYGDDGADGSLEEGGANIAVSAGQYKIVMDLNGTPSYTIEAFSWGVIGNATPGGWAEDTDLKYDPTSNQFRLVVKLIEGEIKFRKNNDWGTNLGGNGTPNGLEAGGANIPVTAGNYVITLNLNENTYLLESIPNIWGIVGSATPNGWSGPDVQMELDYTVEGYTTWYLNNVALVQGDMKFRANNDWTLNYGDDDNNGSLEEGGANIPVSANGNYKIVMDLVTKTYTFQ